MCSCPPGREPVEMERLGVRTFRVIVTLGMALAMCAPAAATTSCVDRLLSDWRDGRIDRTYSVSCYRDTLATLPEDILTYSTAPDDITRALHARLAATRGTGVEERETDEGGISLMVAVGVAVGAALAAAALT